MGEREPASAFAANGASESAAERKVWTRVLVLALCGFAVGVAWPKLTGVRFGPSAPGESAASGTRAPERAEPAAVVAPALSASSEPVALPAVASQIQVRDSFVLDCVTNDDENKKGPECGVYRELDALAVPKLRKLAACPAAHDAIGQISLVANVNFAQRRVDGSLGKSTSLSRGDAGAVFECLKRELEGLEIAALPHPHKRYTLVYKVDLTEAKGDVSGAPASSGAPAVASEAPAAPVAAGETAEVTWDVAIVRSTPRTGEIVARVPRGSKLKLLSVENGWWRVKYGADFGSEGWVFRGAIGR